MTVNTVDGVQKTTKLEGIGKRAMFRKDTVFNNIGHVVDLDLLRECYRQLDGKKAVGIDGKTLERHRCSQFAEGTIGSRMREICTSGSEEGSIRITWWIYSPPTPVIPPPRLDRGVDRGIQKHTKHASVSWAPGSRAFARDDVNDYQETLFKAAHMLGKNLRKSTL